MSEEGTSNTVYVGQLSWGVDEDMLRNNFEKFGEIISTRIPKDDRGRSKGFGFVEFKESSFAEEAVKEMDGKELDGRNIKVNISQPRERSERRGGGGGYGDRRGGDRGGYGGERRHERREGGGGYGGDRRGGDRRGGYRERY